MDKIINFIKTPRGKIISLGLLAIIIIVTIVLISIFSNLNGSSNFVPTSSEEVDPSGVILYTDNSEPEGAADLLIVGFQVFYDYGFSSNQQKIIYSTVYNYFKENYPEFTRISFLKDSFSYLSEDDVAKSTFKLVSNTKETFVVNLDTEYSYQNISVEINSL